jgi:uncharacterized protein (DUF924 family)
MPGHGEQAAEVLEFWFAQSRPRQWFAKDPAFDALLRKRFLALTRQEVWRWYCCWTSSHARSGATPPWPSRAIPRPRP